MNSSTSSSIIYWNREQSRSEQEKVYGDQYIRWAYQTPLGGWFTQNVLIQPWFSRRFGAYQSSPQSAQKIPTFIQQYQIPMHEFESGPFPTFNDFFIRKFRPEARPFDSVSSHMPAFAEGRYFAYSQITPELSIPVKGQFLGAGALLGPTAQKKWGPVFEKGPLMICRLCPTDYHRFHFPDQGKLAEFFHVPGKFHSVNPIALKNFPEIFCVNERQVSILESQNFGKLAYIEVGAMCVGKIVQSYSADQPFQRGQEKGYFLFGASTVILLGEPGRWTPDRDLLDQTSQGRETLVKLGKKIGQKL